MTQSTKDDEQALVSLFNDTAQTPDAVAESRMAARATDVATPARGVPGWLVGLATLAALAVVAVVSLTLVSGAADQPTTPAPESATSELADASPDEVMVLTYTDISIGFDDDDGPDFLTDPDDSLAFVTQVDGD